MRKILWVVVSCLMALSLIMAACAPAATPAIPSATTPPTTTPTTTPPTTSPPETEPPQNKPAPSADVPKYGGTITYRLASDPTNFDTGTKGTAGALINTVYEQFTSSDWRRGPAGSNDVNFAAGANGLEDYGPQLVDSWEMPSLGVYVLHVRQGVHWQPINTEAGKLMAGREVTVDDLIKGFNRLMTAPGSWIKVGHNDVATTANMTKTGPWEITLKTPVDPTVGWQWIVQGAGFYKIYPQDVINKYGDIANWKNAVGTGPYMLTDYVPGSQMVYAKNPVYYEKNPLGPGKGNQLPYADAVRELIIPDLSTTQAAFRTGKLDLLTGVVLEDWKKFSRDNTKLESVSYMTNTPYVIAMRQDKKDKPFSDLKVRQALMYATDFNSWIKDYYGGNAEVDVNPVNKQVGAMYQPLSEMPAAVQDLYKYNPDKAKQLLKEAGYPNGFKAAIVVSTAQNGGVDELSIYKSMWSKVGITV